MPRFFVNPESIKKDHIIIEGENFNHIKNVLRLKKDDNIVVCDGQGRDYTVRIEEFLQGAVSTSIVESEPNKTEPSVEVTLYQGIPKADKMEFIIQKSVELGIKKIVPVMTERTIVKLDGKDAEKKTLRWQKIALEAAKQSNRGSIPSVEFPMSFDNAVKLSKENGFGFIPYEKEMNNTLKTCLTKLQGHKRILFFIGPEGGFSEDEITVARKAGIIPVSLGPRILRTETAGISFLSILMYEIGDMGI